MNRSLFALLGFGAFSLTGCGPSPRGASVPGSYPVRQDYLVTATPKVTATKPYDLGYPPLSSLDLPAAAKDADQKSFATELDNKNIVDCSKVSADDRRILEAALGKQFGTPANPRIELNDSAPESKAALADLKLDEATLARGGELFRTNCLQCHGLSGSGNGPGGKYLYPMPRDYRQGLFKFITTEPSPDGTKPNRNDLFNTIWLGLPGSGMISFAGLKPDEVDALVSHVIFLAIRGEAEYQTLRMMLKFGLDGDELEPEVRRQTAKLLKLWADSQKRRIKPPANPYTTADQQLAAAAAGYKLFMDGQQGACTTCHVNFGRNPLYQYDAWGTIVQPRNLTIATRRGGNGPENIYDRITGGIQGSGMPSHAHLMPKPGDTDNKIWQLVFFVQSISNPETRQQLADKYQISLD